jgi:hypothetical protein
LARPTGADSNAADATRPMRNDWLGYRRRDEFEDVFERYGLLRSALTIVVCYFAVTLLGKREGAQFIYFQF